MKVSLRALRYLVATAEVGNITEAARGLYVSQPSVSAAIAQIEDDYGVQVFIRHHARGVTVTSAGQALVKNARLLLNHARDFDEGAVSLGEDPKGEISVGCFAMLATRFMPGLLTEFGKAHPGISLRLEEGDQQEILQSLLSGRTEIAVSYGFALSPEILGELLVELPPFVIVGAKEPLARRSKVSLRELEEEPFLLLDLPKIRQSAFDERTSRHDGYGMSQSRRTMIIASSVGQAARYDAQDKTSPHPSRRRRLHTQSDRLITCSDPIS